MKSNYRSTSSIGSSVGGQPDLRRCRESGNLWSAVAIARKLRSSPIAASVEPLESLRPRLVATVEAKLAKVDVLGRGPQSS
jgi:hypothetical protein